MSVFSLQIERKDNQHLLRFNIQQPIVTVAAWFDPAKVQTNHEWVYRYRFYKYKCTDVLQAKFPPLNKSFPICPSSLLTDRPGQLLLRVSF